MDTFCMVCGKPSAPDTQVCSECGALIAESVSASTSAPSVAPDRGVPAPKPPSTTKGRFVLILGILGAVLVAVLLFAVVRHRMTGSTKVDEKSVAVASQQTPVPVANLQTAPAPQPVPQERAQQKGTPLVSELVGKWNAAYSSANGDGFFEEHLIISQSGIGLEALRWTIAECSSCDTAESRKSRINQPPVHVKETGLADLLKQLGLEYVDGKLVNKGGSPAGDDVIFEREPKFSLWPSFDCANASLPRERAICGSPQLILLDQELSLTFQAAKVCKPKGGLGAAQNVWWRDELSKCQAGDCVAEFYCARIRALRGACDAR